MKLLDSFSRGAAVSRLARRIAVTAAYCFLVSQTIACSDDPEIPTSTSTSAASGAGPGSTGHGGAGTGGSGQGGAGTGGAGQGGAGGSGGAGGAVAECMGPADCPGADTECQTRTCAGGQCGFSYAPTGTPIAAQTTGDCLLAVCDGQGAIVDQDADTDVLDDADACTDDTCSAGMPVNAPSPAGSPCNVGAGKLCDGAGACVECLAPADCGSGVCANGTCSMATCVDGVKNAAETDIDCGGPSCAPCADAMGCLAGADCVSKVCSGGVCAAPTCGDGVINGTDTCDDGNPDNTDACLTTCVPASCGDGFVHAGVEGCDDANPDNTDACIDTCALASCGDGFVYAGVEGCDDANPDNTDACIDTCAVASCGDGFVYAGFEGCDDGNPSEADACLTTCAPASCGDGFIYDGVETCDDSNTAGGDGCSAVCILSTGEVCADPLALSQATEVNGAYTWNIPAGSVTKVDGGFTCDDSGSGPDAVIVYNKVTADLAGGGRLLHVKATTAETSTAYYLNLEIVGAACEPGQAVKHKCLWYKHDWDSYLDLPVGTYYIWVAKNSPAGAGTPFPATTVTIEEVDAAASEGEACFAPYTDQSAIYTPPAMAGDPHTWTVPATINSFDMGVEWGEPGSISCDDTPSYGDIHGVDAVIEFNKVSPMSILKVDVQNLDPMLAQSDLNVELLSTCDPLDGTKISRGCKANLDTISFTTPAPVGPSYLWVSTEATSEELNGASVKITEIFPGLGESWGTAEPLSGSGPINPTSGMRLDAPSCFPAVGNIHWYSYTLMNNAVSISADVADAIAVIDAEGKPLVCSLNALAAPIGLVGDPGTTFIIGVETLTAINTLTLNDIVYTGLTGTLTDLNVTFPTSAVAEYAMAVSSTELFIATTTKVFAMPKGSGAMAAEYGTGQGITGTHLGYDIEFGGGSVFSVDSTTTAAASRLFRIFDGTTWGPTTWDLAPTYPASSPTHSLTFDGTNILMATRNLSGKVDFYSFPTGAPAAPVHLGTNTSVDYVVGLAADSQYFYVVGVGQVIPGDGVFRISRASVNTPAVKLATIDASTLKSNIEVDNLTLADNLYVRNALGDIHVISTPSQPGFVHLGAVSTLGTSSDYAMTFDHTAGRLFFFETESDAAGRVVLMD
jgi:cysteine-rich repeat protein